MYLYIEGLNGPLFQIHGSIIRAIQIDAELICYLRERVFLDETESSKEITTETGASEYLSSKCAAMRPFKCVGHSGQPLQRKALFDQFYAIARRAIAQFLCDCPITTFHNQARTQVTHLKPL